tara:strand:- start:509 stop:1336 length:828 start_codon:yes stop_codon:yes gene_type:complete
MERNKTMTISAIPDQNPEKLNRLYALLSNQLESELGINVKYIPVINYPAAVTAFRTSDLDIVWFGGLTGVQARLQKPGSIVLAQREIDRQFHSVFIANKKTAINQIENIDDLKLLKGKRFTYGSETSTSGRLMPQYYLQKAEVSNSDFKGRIAGFSGSHDATLTLVESGSYEVGALNEQIFISRMKKEGNKYENVKVIWRTPAYVDYHWLAQGNLDKKFGEGFTKKLRNILLDFNKDIPEHKQILDLFGANKFIKADSSQYKAIEKIGREIGKIR